MTVLNKLSRVTGPLFFDELKVVDKSLVSKSQKLFSEEGLTYFNEGIGSLLPLLVRSLRKLEKLVRREMAEISALEIVLPTLTQSKLFEKSGRINIQELYKLIPDNGKQYILSPTHEEAIANLMASSKFLNFKQLPCRFFQITNKFRNEKRPKSGLLRSKEFLMKDLYCFDQSVESSENTYKQVVESYKNFFKLLGVPYVCVTGSNGDIGGINSDEFHFLSDAGEDNVFFCHNCGNNGNLNFIESSHDYYCFKCQSTNVEVKKGIEVGHTFNLGTTYTKPFNATFLNKEGNSELLYMSSFGLGLTRIIGAAVEVLCTPTEMRWPISLAPYLVCVLPPKAGSKEEAKFGNNSELIYHNLNEVFFDQVVLDDKLKSTLGKRIKAVKKLGFPFVIVIGKSILSEPPCVEIHDTNAGTVDFVQIPDINQFVLNKLSGSSEKVFMTMKSV